MPEGGGVGWRAWYRYSMYYVVKIIFRLKVRITYFKQENLVIKN